MKFKLLKQMGAVLLSVAVMTGCGSMNATTKDTLTGAGIGAGAGYVVGKVIGINPKLTAAAGAGIGAWLGHEHAVKKARELAKEAEAQHLNATVETKEEQNPEGKKQEVLSKFVLPLNAQDVTARGESTKKLLIKAADIANADKAGQKITVHLYGSTTDLQWMSFVVTGELSDKNAVQVHQASTPHLELSPVPTIASK